MSMNQKGFANIILLVVVVAIITVGGYFVLKQNYFTKSYRTYAECVAKTEVPCKFYYVGDFGQEWRPSEYKTEEECNMSEKVVGSTCVSPKGNFADIRWISSVDLERASRETTTQDNPRSASSAKPTISSFEDRKENGEMVLYKVYSDGTSQRTGLKVTLVKAGETEVSVKIVVSPDKTMAAFNNWNEVGYTTQIYISNINGSNTRILVPRSEVGEGQGGINQNSLAWSLDGKYITYFESQLACEAGCVPGSVISYKVTYQVNVATGEKKVISKVPDQYEPQ